MDRSLRIRIEGADATLERYVADCAAVEELLGPGWRERVRGHALAGELARAQARISRARTACAMVGPQPEVAQLLERAARAEASLVVRLDEVLRWCRQSADGSVHQKLARLLRLAEPVTLAPDERVLHRFETPEGTLMVTQANEYFENASRVSNGADLDQVPVGNRAVLELLLRIRSELKVSGAPGRDPGLTTVIPVLRYDRRETSPGICLTWATHLLFLPRRKTGDLLTALLRPRRDEPAIEASDIEVLGVIACVLPWIERELAQRLDEAGLDWLWAWRDVTQSGPVLHHRRFERPAYRIVSEHSHFETASPAGRQGELRASRFTAMALG